MTESIISYDDVKRLFGDISDHKIAEIINSGLPISELEKIVVRLAGDTDHIMDTGRLAPKAQDIYDLLRRSEDAWDDDGQPFA